MRLGVEDDGSGFDTKESRLKQKREFLLEQGCRYGQGFL
jgi:hypothetical protein